MLIRGIGINVISVLLNKLVVQSDLIQVEVEVAVQSCLHVEGVQVILGNDLTGKRVWKDDSPHLVVTSSLMASKPYGDETFVCSLNVLPSCMITGSMSKKHADVKPESKEMVCKTRSPFRFFCLFMG